MLALMRTTLDIDDDLLMAAKELAAARGVTAGRVISDLVRKGLEPARSARSRNGVPLLPQRGPRSTKPTMGLVNSIRDDE